MNSNTNIIKELIIQERKKLPYVLTPSDLIEILPFG
jgi:hypothetical protein